MVVHGLSPADLLPHLSAVSPLFLHAIHMKHLAVPHTQ